MKSQAKLIEDFQNGAMQGNASNIFIEEETLYSYGHHFPLAIRYETEGGYNFVVNGDQYSVSTGCHQRQCFHLGPQIPFSALRAAEIDPYRMTVIDNREDQYHEIPDPTPEDPDHVRTEHVLGAVLLGFNERFYLSSLDENEPWQSRSYFLCQLSRQPDTVDDAFDSLIPNRIREWRAGPDQPRDLRQGEWFFLPAGYETRHLPRPTQRQAQLLETSHYVTELRRNDDLVCRGVVRHRPPRRPSHHRNLKLGKVWHIAVKNLAMASWSAEGMVD